MRYLIAADTRGEMVLCSGDPRRMEVLAERIRQERFFRYVRVADRLPELPRPVEEGPPTLPLYDRIQPAVACR